MLSARRTFTSRDALIVGLIMGVALGIWAWVDWAEPNIHPKNFGVVTPGQVYRSGKLTPAALKEVVETYGIRTVVDLGGYDGDDRAGHVEHDMMERGSAALGLRRYEFRLYGDGTGNPNCYVAALRIIADPANHPVLVHCSAGSERTGACILLYHQYIDPAHRPWDERDGPAFAETLSYGHDPSRNRKMRPYLESNAEKIGEAFINGTWLEGGDAKPVDMTPSVSP